jgi:hypothetical protein
VPGAWIGSGNGSRNRQTLTTGYSGALFLVVGGVHRPPWEVPDALHAGRIRQGSRSFTLRTVQALVGCPGIVFQTWGALLNEAWKHSTVAFRASRKTPLHFLRKHVDPEALTTKADGASEGDPLLCTS